jgi:ATP-dependent Clp protease adaptor protein ClpS
MATDIEEIVTVDNTTDKRIKEPNKYKVVILNDNYTTVEFVIALLIRIFRHNTDSAIRITQQIHDEGSGVAGIYTHEIAEQKVIDATELSRANNFPLLIKAVPE